MNQAQTLKNLMENGTSIEYFNNGYIMQVKDKIKVCEEGKKAATTLTQAQQTKLLLEARGGGQTKQPKRTLKRHVENNNDEAEGETPGNERKYSYDYPMNIDDDEQDDQQIIVEQPKQIAKPKPTKIIKKQPQKNYTSLSVYLEELIRLRTENSFIKQYHQESIKQDEKYKVKIKDYKQKKLDDEQAEQIQTLPQEQIPEQQEKQDKHVSVYLELIIFYNFYCKKTMKIYSLKFNIFMCALILQIEKNSGQNYEQQAKLEN